MKDMVICYHIKLENSNQLVKIRAKMMSIVYLFIYLF